MRVSTSQIYNIANIGMRDAQVEVDKTNQQLTSGKRVLSPADDPVAATSILALNQELSRITQFNKNIDTANNDLSLEDTTLQSVMNVVQRLKELATQAGNTATLTPSDYKAIAAEVDSRLDELTNLQNTRNASGQYIFGGFQSEKAPFVSEGGGNFSYQGDEGQLRVQASTTVTVSVTDSGKKLFMDIPSGNHTFTTMPSSTNKSSPPAIINVGDVYDQVAFDKMYPEDLVISFNANSSVTPAAPNYTITERGTGKLIVDKQLYVDGQDIKVNGAKFAIAGSPYTGAAATPATIPLTPLASPLAGADLANAAFSNVQKGKFDITVGGVTETLYLDTAMTTNNGSNSLSDLVTALGGNASPAFYSLPANVGTTAASNFQKLQNLGITFTATGFVSPKGLNITLSNGSPTAGAPNIDLTLGMQVGASTAMSGTTSVNGVLEQHGDQFILESTNKQSLLTSVARFSDAMKSVDGTQAAKDALAKMIAHTLTNFGNAINNLASVQGEVGARQNMLDSSHDLNADVEVNSKTILSQLEDLDYAEASTRLQMQTMVLSAAQQSFIKVSELSLFKYM